MEEFLEVYIKEFGKKRYRITVKDGTCIGSVVDGFVEFLEFTNEYSARSYVENDKRLILKEVIHKN